MKSRVIQEVTESAESAPTSALTGKEQKMEAITVPVAIDGQEREAAVEHAVLAAGCFYQRLHRGRKDREAGKKEGAAE